MSKANTVLKIAKLCVLGGVVAYILSIPYYTTGLYYQYPKFFEITEDTSAVEGIAYVDTLIRVTEEMNAKWMPNDIIVCSTRLMDNPQNFQLGELEAVRYAIRVLRDRLSRLATTDEFDYDCDIAYNAFANDPTATFWPRAETKYAEGVSALKRYRARLISGNARFSPVASNQKEFFIQTASFLAGASQRLANAPRDRKMRLTEETAGDSHSSGERYINHNTPWMQIDDNFYYAQGELYVIRQLVNAVQKDFAGIIVQRKGTELIQSIIDVLDTTQWRPWVVTNGTPGSIFANHSLQLQARLEEVRQKIAAFENIL